MAILDCPRAHKPARRCGAALTVVDMLRSGWSQGPGFHEQQDAWRARRRTNDRLREIQKYDLARYEAIFAEYLAVQKNLELQDLTRDESKGRWKSFLGKWNRGELAEGWYDPDFGKRCQERYVQNWRNEEEEEEEEQAEDVLRGDGGGQEGGVGRGTDVHGVHEVVEEEEEDDDDGYGPAPLDSSAGKAQGPVVPRLDDLQERRERLEEEHEARRGEIRAERKQQRQVQKERLEELVPRAQPGTRERQIEKKREVAASNRAFRDAKEAGDAEVKDGELMGDDGAEGYRAEKKKREKVKNERELRKEEILRARAAEREDRMAQMRGKEEKTMDMLRGLAKARFG
nr:uncharacterized protein CFP56_10289 [Quercus suber]